MGKNALAALGLGFSLSASAFMPREDLYQFGGDIGKLVHGFYGASDTPEEGVSIMLYLLGESMVGRRATELAFAAELDGVPGEAGSADALSLHVVRQRRVA